MFLNKEVFIKKRIELRIDRVIQYLQESRRWVVQWYYGYALVGIIAAGLLPILLPLMVADLSHQLSWVGIVLGAYNLGLLCSFIWGRLADKYQIHRLLFFSGIVLLMLVGISITYFNALWIWMLLAFLAGASVAATTTVATLFVVEFNPQKEWEARIAWLQTFYRVGQVMGLLMASAVVINIRVGFIAAASILIPALLIVRKTIPKQEVPHISLTALKEKLLKITDIHYLGSFARMEMYSNTLHFSFIKIYETIGAIKTKTTTPFGRFMVSWFLLCFGISSFFAYLPVTLKHAYNVSPSLTSLIYGVFSAAAIILYTYGGKLSAKWGSNKVYRAALMMRLAGFALLFGAFFLPFGKEYVAIPGFIVLVITWPLISISGTDLVVKLSPYSKGATMGLFNAILAIASVMGSFVSAPLQHYLGYASLSGIAILSFGVAYLVVRKVSVLKEG
ncbi:MFS transporter [Hydrotalea sp.]|uniref:MFS transporter n=1 Tax=Hydrotalea sp. TaxID=2881279 RepID=UPI00260FA6ED|nr:MFS transporter [Hydrotalea sp.]